MIKNKKYTSKFVIICNEMNKRALNGLNFFPLEGKVKGCWIFVVLNVFPSSFTLFSKCSSSSNVFPQYAPNIITLYPMSSALTSSIATYISSLKAQDNKISILGLYQT
jgi:hypothetical protein